MTNISDSNPRIYVACLAAYNKGYLHGVWIDADQDADQIRGEIAAMLACSPVEDAEEYAIHDYEGFESVSISEAGQQIVQRQLQVAPTLTIRPGFPVRIIVTRDLVFEPAGG